MAVKLRILFLALMLAVGVSGCYVKPVRHLASDAALLKVGESTKEEVLIFLGEPDEHREVGEGVEQWVYRDKKMSFLEKTPLVGKRIGAPEYQTLVVILRNSIVVDCVYSSSDEDETKWTKNFSWQKK